MQLHFSFLDGMQRPRNRALQGQEQRSPRGAICKALLSNQELHAGGLLRVQRKHLFWLLHDILDHVSKTWNESAAKICKVLDHL